MRVITVLTLILLSEWTFSQDLPDSVRILEPFTITGYLYDRSPSDVPASVGILSEADLGRFNNTSLLPALNTLPGVRMEERSPGSYRLSLRGSSLRSPFGVRNVKVYWNGIPLTDAGGNTYLNLLDLSNISSVEVIKGPAGSLYGAGTGGVVLLNSKTRKSTGVEFGVTAGSYDLLKLNARADIVRQGWEGNINYSRISSAGYREQSELLRDVVTIDWSTTLGTTTSLSLLGFYSNVFYQTPGGLTDEQFKQDPRQARPAGSFPGAVEQDAHVNNATSFSALSLHHGWLPDFTSDFSVSYSRSAFGNFAITNYESREEVNSAVRLENSLDLKGKETSARIAFGTEYQNMSSPIQVFENDSGKKGSMRFSDDLTTHQLIAFLQTQVDLPSGIFFTAGLSGTWLKYNFNRSFPVDQEQDRKFDVEWSPRVAILKKFGRFSLYSNVSRGFSPPTLAEVRPSTNVFSSDLNPEQGTNIEVGLRRSGEKFLIDITQYFFNLDETIILQRDPQGNEYFVNAGSTRQNGSELSINYTPTQRLTLWGSFAYQPYRFLEYGDYSGNRLPGVPRTTGAAGIDVTRPSGMYASVVYNFTGKIALSDANEQYADPYHLLGMRIGFKKIIKKRHTIDSFIAVDNSLDEIYSLGNDLNAPANRFYNAAARRNFAVGVAFKSIRP